MIAANLLVIAVFVAELMVSDFLVQVEEVSVASVVSVVADLSDYS